MSNHLFLDKLFGLSVTKALCFKPNGFFIMGNDLPVGKVHYFNSPQWCFVFSQNVYFIECLVFIEEGGTVNLFGQAGYIVLGSMQMF